MRRSNRYANRQLKVEDIVYDEFQRQKGLMLNDLTDNEFLAFILEARAQAIEQAAIAQVDSIMKGRTNEY